MIRPPTTQRRTRGSRQEGQAFLMVALLLAVFGGMAAMAVDFGSMATHRRDLQNAADAIALAASLELPDEAAAQAIAETWAAKNDIALSEMQVTFVAQNPPTEPNPKVIVQLTQGHEFIFARLIGVTNANVGAVAAAIKTSAGGSAHLMPWSLKESIKDASAPGQSLVLKYDASNPSNGNFGALRLDGNGANVYRDTIENGSTTGYCASGVSGCPYPTTVQTETGNMRGPTETGTDYRLDNTSASCDEWDDVVQVNADGTMGLKAACNPFGPGGNPNSLQVIVIPVIASLCNGSCTVTIVEFALFFLEGYGPGGCDAGNDCEVKGRFINSNANFGALTGVFDPNSFSHFVRLVQ